MIREGEQKTNPKPKTSLSLSPNPS